MAGLTGSLGDLRLLLWSLLLVTIFIFLPNVSNADEIFLTVNVKKPLALTSDKFLSYTLDPTVVLTGDALTRHAQRSVNMARALSPAFVRIGGPRSNSYTFVRPHRMHFEEDPNFTITESNWIDVNRWAENAGLDILVCIAPQHTEIGGGDSVWDSRNALDLISFSDQMGFNTSWQLGYECQTRCDVTGIDSGKAVMRLRSMLDAFPRYSKSLVTGPDVVAYRTKQQHQYLQDYLNVAGNALSAITWHPNFAGVTFDDEGVSMQHDSLAIDRDSLYRLVGRSIWKKPLWIAESKPEDCEKQFLGALVWTRRLGNAARLGVQVILRQPNGSNLLQPTPDYWVSVLHKALVGREVLDVKITNGNRSHVHFYCQCTKPSSKYEKGSLTIFGINLTPKKIVVNLKSLKAKTIHKYILLPGFDADNRMFSETVLLNNAPLRLINERELPEIRPTVLNASNGISLKLPSGGIGFWVLPGLKIKSCGGPEDDNTDKKLLKRSSKRLEESEFDENNGASKETNDNVNSWMKLDRNQKRSNQYYNGKGDSERNYIKIEAKRDLDKLEKMFRKRENYDDRMSIWRGRTSYFDFDDRIPEKRFNENDSDDGTNREMRNKLKEYKRRLKQYEHKIKRIEPSSRTYAVHSGETVDSEKVIDAMKLISKMENAMRELEVDDQTNKATLDRHGASNVRWMPSNNRNDRDDTFLDKLLDSKKIKRSSVPSRIEDQLRAIYQMLADERERRRRNNAESEGTTGKQVGVVSSTTVGGNFSRPRRDTGTKFGVDPLGLRREGIYRRLSRFTDETKDRRNRRKDVRSRDRYAFIIDSKDSSDSEEDDDFYGFHKRKPIRDFLHGDVHLSIGNSKEEPSSEYDYEIEDDEERHPRKMSKGSRMDKTLKGKVDEDKNLWVEVENIRAGHVPIDYFEKVKLPTRPQYHKNMKGHSELWEDESMSKESHDSSSAEIDRLVTVEEIVPERHADVQKDRRAKELVVEKLINYFNGPSAETDEISEYESNEEYEYAESYERTPAQTIRNRDESNLKVEFNSHSPVIQTKRGERHKKREEKSCSMSDGSDNLTAFKPMDFDESLKFILENSTSLPKEETTSSANTTYKITDEPANRNKRSTNNLLEDLDREMIFQDDNNLKDCDYRVPRSTKAMKHDEHGKKGKRPLKKPLSSTRSGSRRRSPLRKNRNREETSTSKPAISQQRNSPRLTRRKRSSQSSDDKIGKKEAATVNGMIQEKMDFPTNYKSLDSDKYENTNSNDSPKNLRKNNQATKNVPLNNGKSVTTEMVNRVAERKFTGTRKAVKRRDKSKPSTILLQSQGTNFETQESSTLKIEPVLEKNKVVTTVAPNTNYFRLRKARKGSAKELNETAEETSYSNGTTVPSVGLRSSFYKGNKMVSSRKSVTTTTNAPPSAALPEKNLEESTAKTEEPNALVTEPSKLNKKWGNSESAQSKLRRKMVTTNATPTIAAPTESLLEAIKALTTESPAPKVKKSVKMETTPMPLIAEPKRRRRKKKQTTTLPPIVTAMKSNDETRNLRAKRLELFLQKFLETSSPSGLKTMKSNDEKRSPKPKSITLKQTLETTTTTTPVVTPLKNNDEKKSLKSKKAELLKQLIETTPSPVVASIKNNDGKKLLKSKKAKLEKLQEESFPVEASMKNNIEKQSRKPKKIELLQENSSPVVASMKNVTDKQSLKAKKAELLQKLQAKLREKREKLVNDYRRELLSEINATSEENKNIYRREVMGMMMNEAELRDLVDRAKFEYLKHNKPIDYQITEKSHDVNSTEISQQKYLPKMQEIFRSLHVTQERKVTPRTQNIEMTVNPELLDAQEEASKAKDISPRLNDDATNHKIARRDDKPHYENVDSLERIPFYEPLRYGEDFPDRTSVEAKGSVEFREPLEKFSHSQNDKKIMPNYTAENQFDYSDELGDVIYDTILDPHDEESIQSSKLSEQLGNFMGDTGAKNGVLLQTNSEHNSSDSAEKSLEFLKGKNPYHAITNDTKAIEAMHVSKKRYLNSSDFNRDSQYDDPKYARLSVDRSEFLQEDKMAETMVNDRDSKEKLKDIRTEILRNKKVEADDENTSWIIKRLMDNYRENPSAMIDYADLDGALNSGDYELVMLIPVNDEAKKIRQKRHIENQVTRDLGNSVTHDITIDMIPQNRFEKEDATIDHDDFNIRTNEIVSVRVPSMNILNNHEKDEHSVGEYSIPIIDNRLKMSKENDIKILENRFIQEETVPSIPEIVLTLGKKSLNDEELPDLLETAMPKVEATVTDGIGKEKSIDDFGDRYHQEEIKFEIKRDTSERNAENNFPIDSDIFGTTIMNVKKLFNFLSGLVQAFRVN